MTLPGPAMARRWRRGTLLAAGGVVLILAAVSCGRKSGVDAVREQVSDAAAPGTAATAADASGKTAGPATLGAAYARFLDQPAWSEEEQEPLKFVVVRGTVRGTGDTFEGWFAVGGVAPVLHHFMLNGRQQPAERFAAYAGAAALRQALR